MDFRGPLESQDWGVAADVVAGDLVVTMNGGTWLRLNLPPAAWSQLRADAATLEQRARAEGRL